MPEWPNGHAWKACVGKPTQGSNPCLSAKSRSRLTILNRHTKILEHTSVCKVLCWQGFNILVAYFQSTLVFYVLSITKN
jgi:hypothetical protein